MLTFLYVRNFSQSVTRIESKADTLVDESKEVGRKVDVVNSNLEELNTSIISTSQDRAKEFAELNDHLARIKMTQTTIVALATTAGSLVQEHRATELPVMRVSEPLPNIRLVLVLTEKHSVQDRIDLNWSIDHAPVESEPTRTRVPIPLAGSAFPAKPPTSLPIRDHVLTGIRLPRSSPTNFQLSISARHWAKCYNWQ